MSKVSILMFLFGRITHARCLFVSYQVELQSEIVKEVTDDYYYY